MNRLSLIGIGLILCTLGSFAYLTAHAEETENNTAQEGLLLSRRLQAIEEKTEIVLANQKKISEQQALIDEELASLRVWINRRR